MRIALAQMGSVPGAFGPTVDRMLQVAQQAEGRGADFVVFPATVLTGAYPLALSERRSYTLALLEAVRDFARRTPVTAAVPAYISDGTTGYVEIFLCSEGSACPLRRRETCRMDAENESVAEAPAAATVGDVSLLFLTGDVAVVPSEMTCDAAIALTPLPYCFDDSSTLCVAGLGGGMLLPLVDESPCWVALVQGVGAYDDVVLAGGSFATDSDGVVQAACPLFEESVTVFDVEPLGETTDTPALKPAAAQAFSPYVGVAAAMVPTPTDDERLGYLYRALVVSVRDYVRKSGFSDVIVGLSGGIDSSLVAAIAADALGGEHVLGVLMPGPYSSESSVTDALDLASRLDIPTRTVGIVDLFEAAVPPLSDALGAPLEGLARENLQARLRGVTLMTLANARNALVLNTGNKSESGVGYSTLYGDTVGAYAPLCDIYKGRVFELARWRNERGPHAVIPQNVLVKPPSAELSAGQTDEASLGASYEQIDAILQLHVERGLDAQDIVDAGYSPEVVYRVLRACRQAEFKRRQEPMGPVVSLAPFVDRGWPVVLGWNDRAVPKTASAQVAEPDDDLAADMAQLGEEGRIEVDDVLDAMLGHAARQEQVVGVISDVAFGAFVSGRGPDMDDYLGMPLFSKN